MSAVSTGQSAGWLAGPGSPRPRDGHESGIPLHVPVEPPGAPPTSGRAPVEAPRGTRVIVVDPDPSDADDDAGDGVRKRPGVIEIDIA